MNKNRIKHALAAGLAVCAGAALADDGSLVPPGYTWGLYNCGPSQYNSESRCKLCCRDGFIDGDIDAEELDGCNQMCEDSVFNAPIGWAYWGWIAELIA